MSVLLGPVLLGASLVTLVIVAAVGLCGVRWLRAFVWGGGLPGRLGALPVEEVDADAAPRGWKCAQLLVSPDGAKVRLAGVAIGGAYAVDDVAVCVVGRRHTPPVLSCECGFYAFSDRADAVELLACRLGYDGQVVVRVLCEVDLAGTVIVCDRGYRAERQRVLQLGVLPWCADCAAEGWLKTAELFGADGRPAEFAPLAALPPTGPARMILIDPSVRLRRQWSALRPLCRRCAESVRVGGVVLTPLQLADRLGTEVRWLDQALVPVQRVLASHQRIPGWGP